MFLQKIKNGNAIRFSNFTFGYLSEKNENALDAHRLLWKSQAPFQDWCPGGQGGGALSLSPGTGTEFQGAAGTCDGDLCLP